MQMQLQAQAQHDGQHTATYAVSRFRCSDQGGQADRSDPFRFESMRNQANPNRNDPHFFFYFSPPGQLAKRSPSYGPQNDWQLARAFVIGFMLISDEICAMQLLLPLSLSVDGCCKLQL